MIHRPTPNTVHSDCSRFTRTNVPYMFCTRAIFLAYEQAQTHTPSAQALIPGHVRTPGPTKPIIHRRGIFFFFFFFLHHAVRESVTYVTRLEYI